MIVAERRAMRPRMAIMRPTRLLGVMAGEEVGIEVAEVARLDEE